MSDDVLQDLQRLAPTLGWNEEDTVDAAIKEIIDLRSRLDSLAGQLNVANIGNSNHIATINALERRLDAIRSLMEKWRTQAQDSEDEFAVACGCADMLQVALEGLDVERSEKRFFDVERQEPIVGFPAESEAEEFRRKHAFFPPLMRDNED